MTSALTLEQRLERLEVIVAELESGELDLASALTLFEEGIGCLRQIGGTLDEAQARVKRLTALVDGTFVIDDLDTDG